MVRIAGSTDPNVKEPDYFTKSGEFRVDSEGSPVLLNCLMYKLCYYRFGQVYTDYGRCSSSGGADGGCLFHRSLLVLTGFLPFFFYSGKPPGYDRVRNVEIGNKNFDLDYLEEVYTTQHWLVRVFKVKGAENRG
jgi:dolichyl-diphosphooligosaccharide--protein glycosyltransferase